MKTAVLGTGLSGLVGTRVTELLADSVDFTDLRITTGIDITDNDQVLKAFSQSDAKVVLHMAAKADVDGCEDDKILGEEGDAWRVNVIGTENIVSAAQKTSKRIIYISTDFVFDGTKDSYSEEDETNPVNWYGCTKEEGEKIVLKNDTNTVIRIAYPYRANFPQRKDFVRRILEKTDNGEALYGLTDHIFTPTFIDDIAIGLKFFLNNNISGIYHLVGSSSLTPFEATELILEIFGIKGEIEKVRREEYFKTRAYRPFKLALKNDKIAGLGIKMMSFREGLFEVARQISS